MNFIDENHCKTRVHCLACRNDDGFRSQLVKTFGKFDCPLGIEFGTAKKDLPEWVSIEEPVLCLHSSVVGLNGKKVSECQRPGSEKIRCSICSCKSLDRCILYEKPSE